MQTNHHIVQLEVCILRSICFHFCVESMMKIHEDVRAKPSSWSVVAWLPVINEDLSTRPAKGYHSSAARNMRIHHACWRHFLARWIKESKHALHIVYEDGKTRLSRHHVVGAVIGDQQVHIVIFCRCILLYFAYYILFDIFNILCIFRNTPG